MELYKVYRKCPPLTLNPYADVWVVEPSYSRRHRLFLLNTGQICYGNYHSARIASIISFYMGAGVEHDHLEPVTECDSLQFLTRYIDFDKILKGEFTVTLSIDLGLPSLLTAKELLTKLRSLAKYR